MKQLLTQVLWNLESGTGPTCPAFLQRRTTGEKQPRCITPSAEWGNQWCRRHFADIYDIGEKVACPCLRVRDGESVIMRLKRIIEEERY